MPVIVTNAHPRLRFPVTETKRIVLSVLQGEKKKFSSLAVIFVNHRRTIALNAKYLRHHRTTDVIAFGYETKPAIDGEIFINLDQAKAQCVFYGATFHDEVVRLVIHGVLHLAGHRDASMKNRIIMKQREDFFLGVHSKRRRNRPT
jgi:probable rRNA maturation factor